MNHKIIILLLPLFFLSGAGFSQVFEEINTSSILSGGGVQKIKLNAANEIFYGAHGNVAVLGKARKWGISFHSGMQCHGASNRLRDFAITPDGGMVGLIYINESCVPDETLVVKVDSNGDEEWRHEFGRGIELGSGATLVQDSIIHVYPSHSYNNYTSQGIAYFKYDIHGNILDSNILSNTNFHFQEILDVTDNGDSILFRGTRNRITFIGKSSVEFDFYRELFSFPDYETPTNITVYDSVLYYGSYRFQTNDSYYGKVNLNNNSVKRVDKPDKIGSYHSVIRLDSFLVYSFITLNYDSLIVMDLDLNTLYSTTSFHGIGSDTRLLGINNNEFIAYKGDSARFYKFNPDSLPEIEETEDSTGTYVNRVPDENNNVKIYPNPAKSFINVEHYTQGHYEIHNLTGQIVARGNLNQSQVNISALPAGSYFFRFFPENKNEPYGTSVFVKQ